MTRLLYVALVTALLPLGLPLLLLASVVRPRLRRGLLSRLGLHRPPREHGSVVWIHAASLGEVKVALQLADLLERSGSRVLLTTNTEAGVAVAAGRGRTAWYAPLDHPLVVRRFLDAASPAVLVLVETEIWPVWLAELRRRGIPALLVNGRISARAAARYRRVRGIMAEALAGLDQLLMRSEEDAARIVDLGARPDRTQVVGDLKVGLAALEPAADGRALRARYGFAADDRVLVAGSTDEGEEAIALAAARRLADRFRPLRLLVAPRQPERFPGVSKLLEGAGVRAWRATGGIPSEPPDVVLLDTLGELAAHYAMADAAFVGGSFTARGGQSLVEPARCGCPVLYGPNVSNWEEVARRLEEAGGGFRCASREELESRLEALLGDPAARHAAGEAAAGVIAQLRGATDATFAAIRRYVPSGGPQTS